MSPRVSRGLPFCMGVRCGPVKVFGTRDKAQRCPQGPGVVRRGLPRVSSHSEMVFSKPMAGLQEGGLIGHRLRLKVDTDKAAHGHRFVQGLLRPRIWGLRFSRFDGRLLTIMACI